jgi:hypothetical protein
MEFDYDHWEDMPDRDRDSMVAQKVMGHRIIGQKEIGNDREYYIGDSGQGRVLPHYTSDPEICEKVVGEIQRRGLMKYYLAELDLILNPDGPVTIRATPTAEHAAAGCSDKCFAAIKACIRNK